MKKKEKMERYYSKNGCTVPEFGFLESLVLLVRFEDLCSTGFIDPGSELTDSGFDMRNLLADFSTFYQR